MKARTTIIGTLSLLLQGGPGPARAIRTSSFKLEDHILKPGESPLADLSGDLFDIALDVEMGDATEFGLRFHESSVACAADKVTSLGAVAKVTSREGRIKLRILVDLTSVETFVNNGEAALPCCFVPKNRETGPELYAEGGNAKNRSLRVSKLRSIWRSSATTEQPEQTESSLSAETD